MISETSVKLAESCSLWQQRYRYRLCLYLTTLLLSKNPIKYRCLSSNPVWRVSRTVLLPKALKQLSSHPMNWDSCCLHFMAIETCLEWCRYHTKATFITNLSNQGCRPVVHVNRVCRKRIMNTMSYPEWLATSECPSSNREIGVVGGLSNRIIHNINRASIYDKLRNRFRTRCSVT